MVVSLLTSSPLLPPLPLLCMTSRLFWFPLNLPRVRLSPIAPHSGLEGRHRGPQCPLWNHQAPFCWHRTQISYPHLPTTVLLTPVAHLRSQRLTYTGLSTCRGGRRGVCCSRNDFYTSTPPTPPTHALCVCCAFTTTPPPNPQKTEEAKRGLDGM